jgi:hypothetical protein
MTLSRQAGVTVASGATWEASCWEAPPAYPATWETVEDEELPLLDARLVARSIRPDAALAMSRLDAMIRERQRSRTIGYSAAATLLIREGLDEDPASWQDIDSSDKAVGEAGPWERIRRIARTASGSLGRDGCIRRAREDLLLHTLALESLRLLSASMVRRQPVLKNADAIAEKAAQSDQREAEAVFEKPAVAALCAAFSGFNTAYLFPQYAFQAEMLAAAAWLGWRMDGRRAPLPAAAAEYLAGMNLSVALETADLNDPQAVIQFALGVAGVQLKKLGDYASEQWPSSRPHMPIRRPGSVNVPICRRFIEVLRCL